jgi:hypothetical protein
VLEVLQGTLGAYSDCLQPGWATCQVETCFDDRATAASPIVRRVSILVVQVVAEGLLLGADRNVTITVREGEVISSGQTQQPKVLKWPNREIVVGYVGRAEIDERPTHEWLYEFIGRTLSDPLDEIAWTLKANLEVDLAGEVEAEPMILHLGGFIEQAGQWKPQVWFIRNVRGLDELGQPMELASEFDVSEEIAQPMYFGDQTGNEIRALVDRQARAWQPFWFHQGYDLGTFNMLDSVLRHGMRAIVESHPGKPHRFPDSLRVWSQHLTMAILAYGAYFTAFHEPFQQYVGGGADVVWAEWPSIDPM